MSEPAAAVEVYLYYRAPVASAAAVLAAFERLRAALATTQPDLSLRLLRRPEPTDGAHTWMETYRREGGVDPALEAQIEAAAGVAFNAVPIGARHLERFIACAS